MTIGCLLKRLQLRSPWKHGAICLPYSVSGTAFLLLGNLVRFVLLPGQWFDTAGVEPLIEGLSFDALIVDKSSTATSSSPICTSAGPRSSFLSIRVVQSRCRLMPRCTNDVI